jgi:hypothetical protein
MTSLRIGQFFESLFRTAIEASHNGAASDHPARNLQDGLLSVLIAFCTKAMERFASFHSWLKCICEASPPIFGKLIAFLFLFPAFQFSQLFFKAAFRLQQRHLLRLGRECAALGGEDFSLEFDNLRLNFGSRLEVHHTLGDVAYRLEASNRRLDRTNIHLVDLHKTGDLSNPDSDAGKRQKGR